MGKKNKPVPPGACIFCRSDTDNEITFGKFIHKDDLHVHEKCLFFSSGLKQTKPEDMDIFGFTDINIKKEMLRGLKLKCVFCKTNRATVGCSKHECRKSFHYPCGLKHDALFQHYDTFKAFCALHKPRQKKIAAISKEILCHICFSSIRKEASNTYLYTTCCKTNWFHRKCLQVYAFNAGSYFFKCPMCNDSNRFSKEMLYQGIYIPIRDASWELEDNAYQDLLFRPGCGSSPCKCEHGTKYSGQGLLKLLTCNLCGSQARHKICANLKIDDDSWSCYDCIPLASANQKPEEKTSKVDDQVCSGKLKDPSSPVKIEASMYPSTSSLRPITNIMSIGNTSAFLADIFLKDTTAGSSQVVAGCSKSGSKESGVKELKRGADHSYPIRSRSNLIGSAQPKKTRQAQAKTNPTKPVRRIPRIKLPKKVKKYDCCSPNNPYGCIRKMFGLECRRI